MRIIQSMASTGLASAWTSLAVTYTRMKVRLRDQPADGLNDEDEKTSSGDGLDKPIYGLDKPHKGLDMLSYGLGSPEDGVKFLSVSNPKRGTSQERVG